MPPRVIIARPPDSHTTIKGLIWLYFWMLLWEGALRKWALPSMSDFIFVIRDPIVLVIYFLALRSGLFPWRPAMFTIMLMTALSLVFSLQAETRFMVTLFGIHTDFLHLPLIFVMERVMTRADVVRFGRWTLICSVPILYLMTRQFNANPNDVLNVGAGGSVGGQLLGAMGRVRPAGPFSFVSGVVDFFSVAASFVLYGWLQPRAFNRILLIAATVVVVFAVPVSISRSLLLGELIVIAFGLAVSVRDPKRIPAFLGPAIAVIGLLTFATDSIYVQAFNTRWDEADNANEADINVNVIGRMAGEFTEPFALATDAPILGYGIGLGTLGGARLNTGQYTFLLSESELARCILELGPILGFVFIGWRVWLAFKLVAGSWVGFLAGGDPLAWLLAGSTFFGVIIGQWGPTTNLGFSVFGAGLVLAALKEPIGEAEEAGEGRLEHGGRVEEAEVGGRRMEGRGWG